MGGKGISANGGQRLFGLYTTLQLVAQPQRGLQQCKLALMVAIP